jgi:very-short-patch-repair endonuclease
MSKLFARELRRNMTQAEQRFWSLVRGKRLEGVKFRRQQTIGPFIVDFICVEAKLIVELDGAQHHDEEQAWYDCQRTRYLNECGYEVMRFNNVDVLKYPYQVSAQLTDRIRRGPPSVIRRQRAG